MRRRIWALPLAALLLLSACGGSALSEPETVLQETITRTIELVGEPGVGSTGGEWMVLGLVRSGVELPEGFGAAYRSALEEKVLKGEGVLSQTLYTEYARAVLALTALGDDPADVAGYDLVAPLADVDTVLGQGINGAIYALLALDGGEYLTGDGLRERYVEEILSRTLSDGGYALTGETADPDVTAMALLALHPYRDDPEIEAAVQAGIDCLAAAQLEGGGYDTAMGQTADTLATVILALCDLGVGVEDERFIRGDRTLVDLLMDYYLGGGEFAHIAGEEQMNLMTMEQAIMALAAHERYTSGGAGFFRLTEA